MVVTVCPTTLNVDETLFALQFAARARNVSLGPAHKNVGAKNLLEEGKDLRAKLREAGRKKVRLGGPGRNSRGEAAWENCARLLQSVVFVLVVIFI